MGYGLWGHKESDWTKQPTPGFPSPVLPAQVLPSLFGRFPPHPSGLSTGLPRWLSGKESTCQCRRHGFDS